MLSSVKAAFLLAASASATIYYAGVAESGGEFGVYSQTATPGTGLPGTFGVEYSFINQSSIDVWVDQNKHFDLYKQAIDYITVTKGAYAIFDPHNYMRYNDPSQQPATGSIIGDTSDPNAATTQQFSDFWQELAGRFVDNPKVIFGLMNEPHDMETSLVLADDQAAIDGIRKSGAKQLILAPGNGYTGGHSFTQASQGDEPSSDYLYKLVDPLNNTAIDIHEYLDVDFSGSHQACVNSFNTTMGPLTAWLKQYGLKAMVTEFGGANNTQCAQYLTDALNYMSSNPEYIGWTAWAAGPFWGPNAPCCSDSTPLGSLEPYSLAGDGSPGLYSTVWLPTLQPLVPAQLQREGISSIGGGALSAKRRGRVIRTS
ncbi:MAG: hypothetical protein Q9160_007857 [Pyrenula sp. 1 TL-2023]